MNKVIITMVASDLKEFKGGTSRYGNNLVKYNMGKRGLFKYKILTIENYNHIGFLNKHGFIKDFIYTMPLNFITSFNSSNILHQIEPILNYNINFTNKKKLITTIHDIMPISNPEFLLTPTSYINKMLINLKLNKINYAIKNSDFILVNSTQTREDIIKNFDIEKNRVSVTNFGVDKRFLSKINLKKNKKFVIGYLGALDLRKNVIFAFKAFDHVEKFNKSIKFYVYGKNYINLHTNQKNIIFKNIASEEMLVNIYDSFNVFVFPSLCEGFGLPILEAQSRGLPVIIYKYGKIPKEVRKYCFEAESPEHMAQIIENIKENGYNEKLRKKATEYARSFTWEKCARETLDIYKKVLKK